MAFSVDQALQKAKSLLKQGKNKEAGDLFQTILEKFPQNKRAQEGLRALQEKKAPTTELSQDHLTKLFGLFNNREFEKALEETENFLKDYPHSPRLFALLGAIHTKLKREDGALLAYRKAIELDQSSYENYFNLASTLRNLGKYEEAISAYTKALQINPNSAQAHYNLGMILQTQKRREDALAAYSEVLRLQPDFAEAHFNSAVIFSELEHTDEAILSYKKAIEIKPNYVSCLNNLGSLYFSLARYEEAITACKKALENNPEHVNASYNLGNALSALKRYDEAVTAYTRALQFRPNFAEVYGNLGIALKNLKRYEEALSAYSKSLSLNPRNYTTHYNYGNALRELKRCDEAISAYTKALEINPTYADAYYNLGLTLQDIDRSEEALAAYKKVLEFKPEHADAYNNIGNLYSFNKKYDEAIAAYSQAVQCKPDYASALASKIYLQTHICDWEGLRLETKNLVSLGIVGSAVTPFSLLSCEDNPVRHRKRSEVYSAEHMQREEFPPHPRPFNIPSRLKVGYFSTDFCDHVITRLIIGLLRLHDRQRFSITAYSYGPDVQDKIRAQVKETVDVFKDVRPLSDKGIAELARKDGIDIAVDLTGYTLGSRSSLFAYRAAPVQLSYLGYPGTMGAPFIDYLIADPFVIPKEQRGHYTEKILYMPQYYLVSDNKRETSQQTFSRKELGLPEDGFVFCCFNNTYKITEEEFEIWMRLLQKIENSVLWLLKANPWAEQSLRKETEKRGILPERLIFAERVPFGKYIRRYELADIFLDTFNYNSNATANDALWAGLPVLTKAGQGYIARACGSLLIAIDMPELITTTKEEYEQKALELATQPGKLEALKNKLARQKTTSSLFDTELFTRHLERGYELAYERWFEGIEPQDIDVPDLSSHFKA